MTFDEPYPFRSVRIEAAGYLPAVSGLYKPTDTDVTFDAKLIKGTGPAGIVKNADGKPAEAPVATQAPAAVATGVPISGGWIEDWASGAKSNRRISLLSGSVKSRSDAIAVAVYDS